MRGRRQLSDLVEKQRSARGLDELADTALVRAGEGALMAEQERFHQVVGRGAAVHGDERFRSALAGTVNGACDELLADPRLTLDQYRNGRRCRLLGTAKHRLHSLVSRDDVLEAQRSSVKPLDSSDLAFECIRGECVAQGNLQSLGADRLDHEIGGACPHRRDHVVDAAMRGLNDHRDVETGRSHLRKNAKAVEIGHHKVEHHRIDARSAVVRERRDGGIAAGRENRLIAEPSHHAFEETALHGIVVDDQNTLTHDAPPQPTRTLCRNGAVSPGRVNAS